MENYEKKIMGMIQKITKLKEIRNSDNLIEKGVTSLNMVLVIPNLEYTFNIEIPVDDLVEKNFITINAIAGLVKKLKGIKD